MFGRREVCEPRLPRVTVAEAVAMVRAGHSVETVAGFVGDGVGRRELRVFLTRVENR